MNLLDRILNYLAGKPSYARSPQWPAVRKVHLASHPTCAVCGTKENLDVHHKRPVHLAPQLELDSTNLITLCERYGHHWLFGHGQDWRAYNPNVEHDAANAKAIIGLRQYT